MKQSRLQSNHNRGMGGEMLACSYLEDKGYIILERNYEACGAEIDIIALQENYVVFIEVKYRKNISAGYPREAVTVYKQKKIKKAALCYIAQKQLDCDFRFDVIEIIGDAAEHIENAFW